MSLNTNIDAVRRLLQKPLDSAPNLDTILGAILDESVHLENELGNAGTNLNLTTFKINLNEGLNDYAVGNDVGKIMLVTLDGYQNYAGVIEFTDLQDASTDWWSYRPYVSDRLEDYGYGLNGKIAFYRENGRLKAKVPNAYLGGILTVRAARSFSRNSSLSSAAGTPAYQNLINVRAAMNVLPGAKWSEDANADAAKQRMIVSTLAAQEDRYYGEFVISKRSATADDSVIIDGFEDSGW